MDTSHWLHYVIIAVIALVLYLLGRMWPGWFD